MNKLNIALVTILLALTGFVVAGDGGIFSVGTSAAYFKVNSDGTLSSSAVIAGEPSATASVDATTNTVTLAVSDTAAATIADRRVIRVWASTTAFGAPSTNNIESLTLSGGTALQTITAKAHYLYVTGTNGTASASIVGSAAGTNYLMVADGGAVSSTTVVFE